MKSKEWRDYIAEFPGDDFGDGDMKGGILKDLEAAEAHAERLDRALQSLTPGGSEFVHDPDRCVAFVQDARAGEMRALKAAVKRAQEALVRAEALEAECRRLREALQSRDRHIEELSRIHRDMLDAALTPAEDPALSPEAEASVRRGLSQQGSIDRGSFAEYATETIKTSEETRQMLTPETQGRDSVDK